MNLVANSEGQIVEIQGTSEKKPFSPEQLHEMVTLGLKGIGEYYSNSEKGNWGYNETFSFNKK